MLFKEIINYKNNAAEWNDWKWQLAHCVTDMTALEEMDGYMPSEANAAAKCADVYPMRATPFYLSLAKSYNQSDPIVRQCTPQLAELEDGAMADPLCEEETSPVPRLVHRYLDRALFLTTGACAVRCRHCMRKRVWNNPIAVPTDSELSRCVDYLNRHHEVREVLISGGDPLVLPDKEVQRILSAFASVDSLEMLRIGSRTPVALPQRFTEELCTILENTGKTVWLAAHFNHPQELSSEAAHAVDRLMRHGIPVVNQSVLLKGINDDAEVLGKLFTGLLAIKIKPYYLFHGDPVQGTTCFRTGLQAGLDIMAKLRSRISGMAIPAFAFDLPEGGGKIRLEPDFSAKPATDGAPSFIKLNGEPVTYR